MERRSIVTSPNLIGRKRVRDAVERSLTNSLCFGLYEGEKQIGLARVVSDYATFAYSCDVYVLDAYQGKGLGAWLLATRDAHELYRKTGFTELKTPERWMEILTQN